MKSKKKQKIVRGLFLLVLFFVGNYYLANPINNKANREINSYTLTNVDILRTSGHWNLAPFVIDDSGGGDYTWEEASAETWCSGSGTFEEPYLIENVTIDGGNSGSCFTIKNSDKYFRIENCTVFNSGAGTYDAGIHLDHVDNGTLINNNCSFNNKFGIYITFSNYNTVLGNNVTNNTGTGIVLVFNCNNNTISENNLSENYSGIFLGISNNNTIFANNASNNEYFGIDIYQSNNNTLSENIVKDNGNIGLELYESNYNIINDSVAINNFYGIYLYYCNYTKIYGNNVTDNKHHGIYINYSDNNTISGNTANNNQDNGIYIRVSNNNTVSGNTANNNGNSGIYTRESDYNLIYKNYFNDNNINAYDSGTDNKWDNGVIGNYWDDYMGVDANDDGIGDTPYLISGIGEGQDNYPIWGDGDDIVITIILPLPNSIFGLVAPNYNISIDELSLDTIWYTLDGGGTNYTITSLTGTLNQFAWEALSEGSITIRFYANDTAGNIGFTDVEVIIEIPEDIDGLPAISFGNYYVLFAFIATLSFIILEKRKKK